MPHDYLAIMTHGPAKETTMRHLPLWRQHGAPLLFYSPADKPLVIPGHENLTWGKACHHGEESIQRFKHLITHLASRIPGDTKRLWIAEYDSFCISRDLPATEPGKMYANAFYNRDADSRFTEKMYCHPMLCIDTALLPKIIQTMNEAPLDLGGYFWDRYWGSIMDRAGIEIVSFAEHTSQGYSQNTIEPAHRPSAIAAASAGCRVWHGIKTPEILEAITLASPWVLHTNSNLKKVNYVAYSLYGEREMYRVGMRRNIDGIIRYYPGWSCRIYMPASMCGSEWHKEFATWVKFHPPEIPSMFARFLIADSPDCERFLIRDSDSRIGPREVAAVQAWITSGRHLHLMRDHLAHVAFPICGGMWGGVGGGKIIPSMEFAIRSWVQNHSGAYAGHDHDQKFLADVIYPAAKDSMLQHDSFSARAYPGSQPFPTTRSLDEVPYFVGEVFDENDQFREGDRRMILEAEGKA